MNDVSEGIVLSSMEYRDKDTLISVLTRDFGRLSLVAKGTLSIHSKNASSCLPYSTSEFCFDYREGKTIFPLKTAKSKNSRRQIREDLDLLSFAGLICELTEKMTEQNVRCDETYHVLEAALNHLIEDQYLSVSLFLAFVIKVLGIEPVVDGCVLCGNTKVSSISIQEGGFVCASCRPSVQAKSCTLDELVHFRLVNKASFEHFELLKSQNEFSFQDVSVMMEFLIHHGGFKVRSWDWIVSMMD